MTTNTNRSVQQYRDTLFLIEALIVSGYLPTAISVEERDSRPYFKPDTTWLDNATELWDSRSDNSQKLALIKAIPSTKFEELGKLISSRYDRIVDQIEHYHSILPNAVNATFIPSEKMIDHIKVDYDYITQQWIIRPNGDDYFVLTSICAYWIKIISALYGTMVASTQITSQPDDTFSFFPKLKNKFIQPSITPFPEPISIDKVKLVSDKLRLRSSVKFQYRLAAKVEKKETYFSVQTKVHTWGTQPTFRVFETTNIDMSSQDVIELIRTLKPSKVTSRALMAISELETHDKKDVLQILYYELISSILPLSDMKDTSSAIGLIYPISTSDQYTDHSLVYFTEYPKAVYSIAPSLIDTFILDTGTSYLSKIGINRRVKHLITSVAPRTKINDKGVEILLPEPESDFFKVVIDDTGKNNRAGTSLWSVPLGLPDVLMSMYIAETDVVIMPEGILELVEGNVLEGKLSKNKKIKLKLGSILLQTIIERKERLKDLPLRVSLPIKYVNVLELTKAPFSAVLRAQTIKDNFLEWYSTNHASKDAAGLKGYSEVLEQKYLLLEDYVAQSYPNEDNMIYKYLLTLCYAD